MGRYSEPFVFTLTAPDANWATCQIDFIRTGLDRVGPSDGSLDPKMIERAVEKPWDVAVLPNLSYAFVSDVAYVYLPEAHIYACSALPRSV